MSNISDAGVKAFSWLVGMLLAALIVASPWAVSFVAFKADAQQTVTATVVEKSEDMNGIAYAVAEIPSVSGSKQVLVPGKFIPGDVTNVSLNSKGDIVQFNWILPLTVSVVLLLVVVPLGMAVSDEMIWTLDNLVYQAKVSQRESSLTNT